VQGRHQHSDDRAAGHRAGCLVVEDPHDADDEQDRRDGRQQHREHPGVVREERRPDQVEGPVGVAGREASGVTEPGEHLCFGVGSVDPRLEPGVDGISDGRAQLAFDVGALLLREAAQGRRDVAVGQRSRHDPSFRAFRAPCSSFQSWTRASASATPSALAI
jgi:hypothetical protein